jgi:drug/metabolite transporter (DMT)-like permease
VRCLGPAAGGDQGRQCRHLAGLAGQPALDRRGASWCGPGRRKGIRLFGRDGTLGAGLLSAALFAGEFAFIYWGLSYTTASRGVVFLYTAPFMIALGAHWFLPGEKLRPLQWLGLACAFAGILAAFGESLGLPRKVSCWGTACCCSPPCCGRPPRW